MRVPRFLFCIVGVGAGNTTRNLAILRELQSIGPCEILVAAQGKAHELLSPHFKTVALQEVTYSSSGDFGGFEIIKNNLGFPARFLANLKRYEEILTDFRPDLVVADSDFYCLRPARRLGYRLASINNSAVVVESIKRDGGLPKGCGFSYNVIEKTDYWLQRKFPHRVLCPTIRRTPGLAKKFVQIPPMVRPTIQPLDQPGDEIVVLTGGSGIDVAKIDLRDVTSHRVRMLGTPLEKAPTDAIKVGFTLDVMEHLRRAKVLVVQGGFSSISEAVALRIPTVVVPIQNHAEQWANGQAVAALGVGVSARSPAETGRCVARVLANHDRHLAAARSLRVRTDGHLVAARLLRKWAEG